MSGYQPDGGWSGRIVADAPLPAPVVVEKVVEPVEPAPVPSFAKLALGFFLADFVIEIVGSLLIFYVFTLFLALDATYGDNGAMIGLNLVWVIVSIPLTQGVLQLVLAMRPVVVPLAVALLLGLGLRFGLEAVGAPRLAATLLTIPIQAAIMLAIPNAFTRVGSVR